MGFSTVTSSPDFILKISCVIEAKKSGRIPSVEISWLFPGAIASPIGGFSYAGFGWSLSVCGVWTDGAGDVCAAERFATEGDLAGCETDKDASGAVDLRLFVEGVDATLLSWAFAEDGFESIIYWCLYAHATYVGV